VIVVDSSVVLQWILVGPGAPASDELLQDESLAAPDVLYIEVANVLAKKVRLREIGPEQARDGLAFLEARFPNPMPSLPLVRRTLDLSIEISHPVYDCAFLACAIGLDTFVASRDQPFVERATRRGYGDHVRLYPTTGVP
jgi:predicted nucleic acid-binding protein